VERLCEKRLRTTGLRHVVFLCKRRLEIINKLIKLKRNVA